MSRTTKIWLIIAALLIIIGCLMFAGGMTMLKWDFTKLSSPRYINNTHTVNNEFDCISVETKTANVVLMPSEDGTCRVECVEQENARHSVAVLEETLYVRLMDERKWYQYIGFCFDTPQITLYLPRKEYDALSAENDTGDVQIPSDFPFQSVTVTVSTGDVTCAASVARTVDITASTGHISVEGITAGALDLTTTTGKVSVKEVACQGEVSVQVSTGRATLTDVTCQSLLSTGDTGDITLKNVVVAGTASLYRTTGHVTFEGCDAAELTVKTSTGDVRGSLLSPKIFFPETDTGRVEVPKTVSGGRCEVETSTGDICLTVP